MQHVLAIAPLGASGAMIALKIVEEGSVSPSVQAQGILLGGAIAIWLFFDRRAQVAAKERSDERRAGDIAKDARIKELEAKVEEQHKAIIRLLSGGRDA